MENLGMAISKPSAKDVLLTHSYFLHFDTKELRAMMPYPPLGTLYAASALRHNGFSVFLFDSMLATAEEELVEHISRERPRVVLVFDDDFNYLTKMCLSRMREATFRMARIAKKAGCIVVVHGSDSVDHLTEYFANCVDYVICGEGEQTLVECIAFLLREQGTLENIRGLSYKRDGEIALNAPRPAARNLDTMPFPAWDLIEVHRYRNLWKEHHGYFSLNMVTTRGCPYHCNWCAKPIYGQVYNSRSPQNVVEEMLYLKEKLMPDHLWFCDDIFGLRPGWIPAFSEEVTQRDAVIPYKCLSRVDLLLKEDTVEHLRRSGCHTVWVGAESGSQKVLDAMEKGTTVEQIYEASARLQEAGIRVGFFLQYGYPGEEKEDIERTLQMVRDCKPDEIGISVSYPLPGTKFYDRVANQMGSKHNWVESDDLEVMFQGRYQPEFYRVLHKVTHKQFRMWQGLDFLKESFLNPSSINRSRLRRIASVGYHFVTLPPLESKLRSLAHSGNGNSSRSS